MTVIAVDAITPYVKTTLHSLLRLHSLSSISVGALSFARSMGSALVPCVKMALDGLVRLHSLSSISAGALSLARSKGSCGCGTKWS